MNDSHLISRELTTQQLDRAFRSNEWTSRIYRGVYPVDLLPRYRPARPCFIVVNLDDSNKRGRHWTLVFFPLQGPCFLFDSFGQSAESENLLSAFLGNKYRFNRTKLQHEDSKSCGYFVLAVGLLLARGVQPENLSNFFSRKTSENDRVLQQMVRKNFGKLT